MSKELITSEQVKALEIITEYAFSSKHFEKLGGKAGIFCVAMYAQEMGLPVMPCLFGGIKPVLGNVEIAPRMMNSMIRKAGHRIHILQSTNEICTLRGKRCDTQEEYECSFTMEDARRAGLYRTGGGWDKYPSDMLFVRCVSRLARRLFPDVVSSAYVEGEIEEEEPLKEETKVYETAQEAVVIEEPISKEELENLENSILEFDDCLEYRQRLLTSCVKQYGPMNDFSSLPKKGLDSLLAAIQRRKEKQVKKGEN